MCDAKLIQIIPLHITIPTNESTRTRNIHLMYWAQVLKDNLLNNYIVAHWLNKSRNKSYYTWNTSIENCLSSCTNYCTIETIQNFQKSWKLRGQTNFRPKKKNHTTFFFFFMYSLFFLVVFVIWYRKWEMANLPLIKGSSTIWRLN